MRAGSSTSEKVKEELNRDLKPQREEDLASFNQEKAATGDNLVISNIKNALATAEDALEAIEKTLQERLYQAREAAAGPHYSARNETLNESSYGDHRLEGERILSEASSNGRNPISGSTYTSSTVEGELRSAVATGAVAVPELDQRSRLHSASDAANEVERLGQVISSFRSTQAGYAAASAKADSLSSRDQKETPNVKSQDPNALASIEEAKDLAGQIASKIGSAHNDEQTAQKLIEASAGNLDLDRVKSLLS